MEFDYSCFRGALNDVLMNCVMNCKFHKIGEYLDKLSNHWHLRKYCILDVFSVMICSVLFSVMISSVLFSVMISSVLFSVMISSVLFSVMISSLLFSVMISSVLFSVMISSVLFGVMISSVLFFSYVNFFSLQLHTAFNLLNPAVSVMHHQFNIPQLYTLPSLCLCVLYLSENKQRLVPLTA